VSADFGVSVEEVVATEPDLVLAPNASADAVEPLREAGLTVYHFPEATDIADIRAKTTTIGTLTGNCKGAAEANAWMDANVDAVAELTADLDDRRRVLHPLGGDWVVGDETYINTMLELAGADNVAARNHTGYVQLNDEVVLQLDPEVLILTQDTTALVDEEPYASTSAGEANTTVVLRTEYLHQPAPRSVVFSTHNTTTQLYPDRYSDDSYVPRSAITVEPSQEESPATATDTTPPTTDTQVPGFGAQGVAFALVLSVLILIRRR
jgi:iron complex transport system substrate-binding protein